MTHSLRIRNYVYCPMLEKVFEKLGFNGNARVDVETCEGCENYDLADRTGEYVECKFGEDE